MRKGKYLLIVALLAFVSYPLSTDAFLANSPKVPTKAKIRFTILDCRDSRVPDAEVILTNGKSRQQARSDASGECEIEIPAGVYRLTVDARKLGFSLFREDKFKAEPGREFRVMLGAITPVIID